MTKIIETRHIFIKKVLKNISIAQIYPKFPFPPDLVLRQTLKYLPGSAGQKLQPTLNKKVRGASLTIFVPKI